jgi:diaphanous 1
MGAPSSSKPPPEESGHGTTGWTATPLSPQSTGGLMKRFSLWGTATSPSMLPVTPATPTVESKETPTEAFPIFPQLTGSLWGNWWASSPREPDKPKDEDRNKSKSSEWFVNGIRNGKTTDTRLAKHLISLRVHLSTAKVTWVERFLEGDRGMDALSDLLESLVRRSGPR